MLLSMAQQGTIPSSVERWFALCFEGRLAGEMRACGANVVMLGPARMSRPWTVHRVRARLRRLLAEVRFDAAICHTCWPYVLCAPVLRAHGLPLVFWAHDVLKGRHWLERWARRTTPDLVLANSRFTQAAVPNVFPGVPSEVLYNPVPAADVAEWDRIRYAVRTELGASPGAVVIMLASRLERWKGHRSLLEALCRIRDVPDWLCWIAGGAQRPREAVYLEELREIVNHAGLSDRIRFLGQRKDVRKLLAAADIHCQPNTGPEPFGNVFVEALWSGLPAVTTALGGVLEIVDATCGILVRPGDPDALASALGLLIHDPSMRRRLGANGPARAKELCDPQQSLSRLDAILTQQITAWGNAACRAPRA
jgi:glycosyltransferase involved in cell wall biosynthesis